LEPGGRAADPDEAPPALRLGIEGQDFAVTGPRPLAGEHVQLSYLDGVGKELVAGGPGPPGPVPTGRPASGSELLPGGVEREDRLGGAAPAAADPPLEDRYDAQVPERPEPAPGLASLGRFRAFGEVQPPQLRWGG